MLDAKEHSDVICELVNIGAGKAAQVLNQMFSSHINLSIPTVELFDTVTSINTQTIGLSDNLHYAIEMDFTGSDLKGCAMLLFKNDQVDILADALIPIPYDDPTRKTIVISAISEIGNIVINALIGSISNFIQTNIDYSVPKCTCDISPNAIITKIEQPGQLIMAKTLFNLERLNVEGQSVIYLSDSSFIHRLNV